MGLPFLARFTNIIGRRTFSAAQILATQLETYTRAIFVGEPTSSRPNVYGGHVFVHLPNSGIAVAVSPAWYQSAFPHDVRTEIRPRVVAVPVFADYYNNRDPALDAILRWRGGAMLADSVHAAVARSSCSRSTRHRPSGSGGWAPAVRRRRTCDSPTGRPGHAWAELMRRDSPRGSRPRGAADCVDCRLK